MARRQQLRCPANEFGLQGNLEVVPGLFSGMKEGLGNGMQLDEALDEGTMESGRLPGILSGHSYDQKRGPQVCAIRIQGIETHAPFHDLAGCY